MLYGRVAWCTTHHAFPGISLQTMHGHHSDCSFQLERFRTMAPVLTSQRGTGPVSVLADVLLVVQFNFVVGFDNRKYSEVRLSDNMKGQLN